MQSYNKRCLLLLTAILLILVVVAPSSAVQIKSGDMVSVPGGTTKGPLFISGNNLIVNADVDGDVFAAGQTVVINGNVNGDVIAAANSVRVNGNVQGDIRVAGSSIEVNGQIDGSMTGAGNNISLRDGARVKRDVLVFGDTIELFAPIEGQALGSAKQIHINAPINGDVQIWGVQNLLVGASTVISGKLSYRSDKPAQIASEAKIVEVTRLAPQIRPETPDENFSWFAALLWLSAWVLLWGVAYLLFPALLPQMGRLAQQEPWAALGWGFLMLLLTPLAILILMITVVGIPISLLLLLVYIVVLLVSKIITGDFLARCISRYLKWDGRVPFIIPFLIAFGALILLSKVKILGFIISLGAASFALGMLVLYFYRWRTQPLVVDNIESGPTIE
ncbi:MAG: polymer-forming cytoskeletal protein [Syntrophomonas sp.]